MKTIDNIVKYDIDKTAELLKSPHEERFLDYDRVYYETNEACDKLISRFDVSNKKILTVVGSGDQSFHFYNAGCKNVDLFDINKLTIYYYYLRIWNMKVFGTFYPKWCPSKTYIKQLLSFVEPKSDDEMMAYKYWTYLTKVFSSDMLYYFFLGPLRNNYYKDIDVKSLISIIDNDNFSFYNIDISKEIDIPCKYDLIYTSNLSDYIRDDRIHIYMDNLYKHLNTGGIVLSSNISGAFWDGRDFYQKKYMKKCFRYHKIYEINKDTFERGDFGYYYKKRLIKRII